MRNSIRRAGDSLVVRSASILCLGLLMAGCDGSSDSDGTVITGIPLPTDTLLNLACADVGIWPENCVLDDQANPYRSTVIREFDEMNPGAENKFDLANAIPAGRTGAKARFYFWATALARRGSGENQWYTARALHELFHFNDDPVVQQQALNAYRNVLDNFFGSVTFFECCENVDPNGNPVPFSVTLNEQVADNLYREESTGWARLVPGDPLLTISELADWGYTYRPANPPDYLDGLVFVREAP